MTDKSLLTAEEREMLSRVEMMASRDPTWDLSPNDIAALKFVLAALAQGQAERDTAHKEIADAKLYMIQADDEPREWTHEESLTQWVHKFGMDMAQAEREARWIAVTEREPRVGEWCWVVYAGHVQRMTAHLALVGSPDEVVAGKATKEWRWAIEEADPCPFEEITDWMPLPAPPRADELEKS